MPFMTYDHARAILCVWFHSFPAGAPDYTLPLTVTSPAGLFHKKGTEKTMDTPYRLVERRPTVDEYNRVRGAAGLSVKDEEAARRGLAGSLYAVCVVYEDA